MRLPLSLMILASCGGDDVLLDAPRVDAGPGALLNGATGGPADYSCNGSFTLGVPDATSQHSIHVSSLKFPDVGHARIDLISPTTAQPTGTFALADGSSDAQLPEPGDSLVAWHISQGDSCPDTCVESYAFAVRTLSSAAVTAGGIEHAQLFDIDDYVGERAHAGAGGGSDNGEIVGTVVDCTGAPVENARVPLPACGDTSAECVVYRSGTDATGSDGVFSLFDIPAGLSTVHAVGQLGSDANAALGEVAVFGVTMAVSFGTVYPR